MINQIKNLFQKNQVAKNPLIGMSVSHEREVRFYDPTLLTSSFETLKETGTIINVLGNGNLIVETISGIGEYFKIYPTDEYHVNILNRNERVAL